jgi:hypothetical protein
MNKALYILLLFLFACHSNDDKTIAFLNEGIENCDSVINIENGRYYVNFEMYIRERPEKVKPFKNNADKIKQISDKISKTIELIKSEFQNKGKQSQNKDLKMDLSVLVIKYKILIDSLFPKDSVVQKRLKTNFNFEKQDFKYLSSNELIFLENKIINLNYIVLSYFLKKIEYSSFRYPVKKTVVVPRTKYLYFNEIYQANLYLVRTDTLPDCVLKIDGKIFSSGHGIVSYMDSASGRPRNVAKHCILELKSPVTEQIFTFPFILKYQFNNK